MNKRHSMKWYFFFTRIRPWIEILFTFIMLLSTMLYWLNPLLDSGDIKALGIIIITLVYSFIYMVLQFRVFLYAKLEQENLLQQIEYLLAFENYTFGFRIAYSGGWYQEQVLIAMVLFVPVSLLWVSPNTKYFNSRLQKTKRPNKQKSYSSASVGYIKEIVPTPSQNPPIDNSAKIVKTANSTPSISSGKLSPHSKMRNTHTEIDSKHDIFLPFDIPNNEVRHDLINSPWKYETLKGDYVRSKSELIIANMLFQSGVKYEYERLLQLEANLFYWPDFTFILPNDEIIIWEHCGMMNDPGYRKRWESKKEIYEKHNFIEGKNLIVTYETDINSFKLKKIVDTLLLMTNPTYKTNS